MWWSSGQGGPNIKYFHNKTVQITSGHVASVICCPLYPQLSLINRRSVLYLTLVVVDRGQKVLFSFGTKNQEPILYSLSWCNPFSLSCEPSTLHSTVEASGLFNVHI